MIDEEDDFESTDGEAVPSVAHCDRRYAGIRALWLKVIIRAVFDWVTYRDSTKLDKRKYADSADAWLFQKNLLFNSFDNVCRQLDLDPNQIREQVRKMTKDDVSKIEHLERDYEEEEKPILKLRRVSYPRLPSESSKRVGNEVF